MQKHSHKFLKMSVALIAASTLLAVGSPIQAAPVNAQVKVTSHLDTNEKPEQSSDWAKAKKYRHDIPVQLLGINDLHGGLERTGNAWFGNSEYANAGGAIRLASYLNHAQSVFDKANKKATLSASRPVIWLAPRLLIHPSCKTNRLCMP